MKKIFRIRRQDPEKNKGYPHFQDFEIDLPKGTSILLAFHHIRQHQDSSLTIRSSCRAAVCGSCAVVIDGRPRLACKSLLQDFSSEIIRISPLPSYPVIKDLVVDLSQFFEDYRTLEPWLKATKSPPKGKEYHQSITEREKIDPYETCIMCGVCQGGCPSREKASEEFMGPALMVKAARWIFDSRDEETKNRTQQIKKARGVGECDQFSQCTEICPLEIPASVAVLAVRHQAVLSLLKK